MEIWSAPTEFNPSFRFEPRRTRIGWYWFGAGAVSLCLWGGFVAALASLA
jgi:hypothetical protein